MRKKTKSNQKVGGTLAKSSKHNFLKTRMKYEVCNYINEMLKRKYNQS